MACDTRFLVKSDSKYLGPLSRLNVQRKADLGLLFDLVELVLLDQFFKSLFAIIWINFV